MRSWWRARQQRKRRRKRVRRAAKAMYRAGRREGAYPTLSGAAAYQSDAREQNALVRQLGFGPGSAMTQPRLLKRMARRHNEHFGKGMFPSFEEWAPWVLVPLFMVGPAWLGFILVEGRQHLSNAPHPVTGAILFGGLASGLALGGTVILSIASRWVRVMAPAVVWGEDSIIITVVARLVRVVREPGEPSPWGGDTRKAGPRRGILHLSLPEGKSMDHIQELTDIYGLPAAVHGWEGTTATMAYNLFRSGAHVGVLLRRVAEKTWRDALELWPIVLIIVLWIIEFFMIGSMR